jgi:O-acetyl-ADP-ribose deacetylase (regulator of RNase III)
MKLIYDGNIFNSKMQTITNPINCDGIMGAGLALTFRKKYPSMYRNYKLRCVVVGKPYIYEVSDSKQILNFPTKKHWRNKSRIEYIEDGLSYLVTNLEEMGITSLAIPMLGCGLGGLNWEEDVFPLVTKYLSPLKIEVEIYIS